VRGRRCGVEDADDDADQQDLLSRFIVSVTTLAKSSESELTRLTTLPDGLAS